MKPYFNKLILLLALITFGARAGEIADFELKDINGQTQKFSMVRGEKLTLIDFWATWCKPCLKAIPKLAAISRDYESRGVKVVSINTDSPRNSSKVKPFARMYRINYTILLDPNGIVTARLNVNAYPTLFIINEKNEILYTHIGFRPGDGEQLRKKLDAFLEDGGE